MSLTPDDKNSINQIMEQLLNSLNRLEQINGVDPRAMDLIEIAGHLLQEQIEENKFYESSDEESDEDGDGEIIPPGTFDEEHIENQAASAVNSIQDGLSNEIIKEGGFQFLNSTAKDGDESRDIPSPDELKDWFDM